MRGDGDGKARGRKGRKGYGKGSVRFGFVDDADDDDSSDRLLTHFCCVLVLSFLICDVCFVGVTVEQRRRRRSVDKDE